MPDDPKVTRSDSASRRSVQEADRRQRPDPDDNGVDTPVSRESLSPVIDRVRSRGQAARTIAGTMAFATLFALVSTELGAVTGGGAGKSTNGVRIIIGGGVATLVLLVIAEAGEPGATLAEGLAAVSLVTVVLVKGGPLWTFANNLFGSKPTGSTGSTGATASTSPGTGTPMSNPAAPSASPVVNNPYLLTLSKGR